MPKPFKKMLATDFQPVPRCSLRLSRLGLGGAPLGSLYQALADDEARASIDGAWDLGLRYFDTAPLYGHGLSEHRFGAALRERPRADYAISTKVGRLLAPKRSGAAPAGSMWAHPLPFEPVYDYSRAGVMRSFEDSLQRLGLARVDMLFVHDIGRLTHGDRHAEHWRALTDGGGFAALEELRRNGDVQAFGLGVNETAVIEDALAVADINIVLLAGRYTLLEQRSLPLLARCRERAVSVVIGGPYNSGVLARGSRGGTAATFDYGVAPPAIIERVKALEALCAAHDVPLAAAALQFVMAHPAVVSCIPGGRDAAETQQNVAWFETAIPAAFWQALRDSKLIDADAPIPAEAGHA